MARQSLCVAQCARITRLIKTVGVDYGGGPPARSRFGYARVDLRYRGACPRHETKSGKQIVNFCTEKGGTVNEIILIKLLLKC